MATKLLRLTADERKAAMQNGGQQQPLRVHQFSELEEREAELQVKVRQLEKQVKEQGEEEEQGREESSDGCEVDDGRLKYMYMCVCSSSCLFTSW